MRLAHDADGFQSAARTTFPVGRNKLPQQKPGTGIKIGYARVSTKDQSLHDQIERLREAGVADDNTFAEKVSGVAKRRPRLDEALAKADAGDEIIVWAMDTPADIDMVAGFMDGYRDTAAGVPTVPGPNRSWSYRWGYANALRDRGMMPLHRNVDRARHLADRIIERDNRRLSGFPT